MILALKKSRNYRRGYWNDQTEKEKKKTHIIIRNYRREKNFWSHHEVSMAVPSLWLKVRLHLKIFVSKNFFNDRFFILGSPRGKIRVQSAATCAVLFPTAVWSFSRVKFHLCARNHLPSREFSTFFCVWNGILIPRNCTFWWCIVFFNGLPWYWAMARYRKKFQIIYYEFLDISVNTTQQDIK